MQRKVKPHSHTNGLQSKLLWITASLDASKTDTYTALAHGRLRRMLVYATPSYLNGNFKPSKETDVRWETVTEVWVLF